MQLNIFYFYESSLECIAAKKYKSILVSNGTRYLRNIFKENLYVKCL